MENQTHSVSLPAEGKGNKHLPGTKREKWECTPGSVFLLVQQLLDFLPPSETETERHKVENRVERKTMKVPLVLSLLD